MTLNYIFIVSLFFTGSTVDVQGQYLDTSSSFSSTLEMVQVIHRHGHRLSSNFDLLLGKAGAVPDGESIAAFFGGNYITSKGLAQTRELGQFLRSRYRNLLAEKWTESESFVVSSSVPYSVVSSLSLLRGLYPGVGVDMSACNGTKYPEQGQIVPVETVPPSLDNVFLFLKSCPKYNALFKKFSHENSAYNTLVATGKELQQIFSINGITFGSENPEESGPAAPVVRDDGSVSPNFFKVVDLVNICYDDQDDEDHENTGVKPEWVTPKVIQLVQNFTLSFLEASMASTVQLKRLRSLLVQTVLANMEQLESALSPSISISHNYRPSILDLFLTPWSVPSSQDLERKLPKLFIYSGHDMTLITFLSILGVFNHIRPPHSSAVLIETFRGNPNSTHSEDFFIQVLYRNDTETDPFLLEIPGCAAPCSLTKLKTVLQPVLSLNYTEECKA